MLRTISNTAPSTKIGNVKPGTKVHIQVLNGSGAIVCRFAERGDLLENPEPFSGSAGMAFTSDDGVLEIVWQWPEIWALGDPANSANPVINFDGGQYG